MTHDQTLMRSASSQSLTRSSEHERSWEANWTLLRRLWPKWDPTDEMISEVWFRSWDKKHGVKGPDRVNHEALRTAILLAAKSSKWKEPSFLDIADSYRHEQNRVLAEIDRVRYRNDSEREANIIRQEHLNRVRRIEKWPIEQLRLAMDLVARRFPTYSGKSTAPSSWSSALTGLIIAADEEIGKVGSG